MHARHASRLPVVVLLGALALAAGCTSTDDSPGTPETGDSPAASSSSAAPEPSSGPTTSEVSPTPDDTPLVDRLLPTDLVPGLNSLWKWQDGDTGAPTTDPFGVCAKADLLSIGASEAVARTYFPPDDSDDNAAEQIAVFPDASTANRAWKVLASWHKHCGRALSADSDLRVRPFRSVPVTAGTARWYLLSWTPPGEETGRFEALGMVLNGTRIAVLRMDNSGQDRNYPAGEEPMIGMVTAAAGWLD
jgi:hypothetical protein